MKNKIIKRKHMLRRNASNKLKCKWVCKEDAGVFTFATRSELLKHVASRPRKMLLSYYDIMGSKFAVEYEDGVVAKVDTGWDE